MARAQVQWTYSNMTSIYSALDATNGFFIFTTRAEWKVKPSASMAQRLAWPLKLWSSMTPNPKFKTSLVGSIHRVIWEVRHDGPTSCHVTMWYSEPGSPIVEFDLTTTPGQDFVDALEKIGEAKIEHPYFLNDRQPYHEDVSFDVVKTKVTFNVDTTPHG